MHEVICSGVPAAKLWLENFFEELEEDGEESLARRLLGESEDGTHFLPCLALAVPGCYAAI